MDQLDSMQTKDTMSLRFRDLVNLSLDLFSTAQIYFRYIGYTKCLNFRARINKNCFALHRK